MTNLISILVFLRHFIGSDKYLNTFLSELLKFPQFYKILRLLFDLLLELNILFLLSVIQNHKFFPDLLLNLRYNHFIGEKFELFKSKAEV